MSRPPSSQTTPQYDRVNDGDMTEIELCCVDSINDLHRTHPEQYSREVKPPSPEYTPSLNGNLYTHDGTAANHRGRLLNSKLQSCLHRLTWPRFTQACFTICGVLALFLLPVALLLYVLVRQEGAIRMLTKAVGENEAAATELSQLIQDLQALRLNLTARGGT